MKPSIEVIDNSVDHECYKCDGKGQLPIKGTPCILACDVCKGTGKWKEDHFIFITKDSKGHRIAIDGDQIGK